MKTKYNEVEPDEEEATNATLPFPALNGVRRPKQAGVDVAPVKVLIAGNRRDGPSTSTPAEAAAGAPFTTGGWEL
ncbi:hypothetical protein [Halalkalibaculum sp. DA384]|uniref:hypothetical protein n=1 Tax=Halalkalibaculum sp. DA384 TaxID=3373606 RepID=UPI0037549B22